MIGVSAAVAALITLPLVPAAICTQRRSPTINEDAIETVGWPALAATVASVWNRLPPAERADAVVFTGNYGEAGAIARYGPALGDPAPTRATTRSGASAVPGRRRARSS